MGKTYVRLLSWLLHLSNASPPMDRSRFYAMKERILARYATPAGTDVQHILKLCYTCEGTGRYYERACRRCFGSGKWSEVWIYLARFDLAGRVFHKPGRRVYVKPDDPVAIEGYVRHESVGRGAHEAALWLALLCDRRYLCRMLWRGGALLQCWGLPLSMLQSACFALRRLAERVKRNRCYCGRSFRHWFDSTGWLVCRACRKRTAEPCEDLPF